VDHERLAGREAAGMAAGQDQVASLEDGDAAAADAVDRAALLVDSGRTGGARESRDGADADDGSQGGQLLEGEELHLLSPFSLAG